MPIGISLGWNCYSAVQGVERGLRLRKEQGYKTCPFDEMVTNYDGIVECIENKLADLADPAQLKLVDIPANAKHNPNDKLIHHSKYKFFFNHESPGHGQLYISQRWSGGKEHYTANNFEKFRERYTSRISNFNEYMASGEKIRFLITLYDRSMNELHDAIRSSYPNTSYEIIRLELEDTPATPRHAFYSQLELMKMF